MNKQITLSDTGSNTPISHELPHVVKWLLNNKLAVESLSYDMADGDTRAVDQNAVLAAPTQRRCEKLTQAVLKKQAEEFKGNYDKLAGIDGKSLYDGMKKPKHAIRTLNTQRLPVHAMAFYRSFHYLPYSQWGIYLLVDELVKYHAIMLRELGVLNSFSPSTLMHFILFEIFHHEFFHHIAESTATTLEILGAAMDKPQPIYLEYTNRKFKGEERHEHAPLEEALANAYAYNSFSFIDRVGVGCKTAGIKIFQAAMMHYWPRESSGYRHAHNYVNGRYIAGAAGLMGLMLGKPNEMDITPLMRVAKSVMPNGFSAYVAKPDIPTYLIGSPGNIKLFYDLVPAPNEAYSRLYWPYDTTKIDGYLKEERAKEIAAKKKAKS